MFPIQMFVYCPWALGQCFEYLEYWESWFELGAAALLQAAAGQRPAEKNKYKLQHLHKAQLQIATKLQLYMN